MSSTNDVTGDALVSKQANDAYRDGWDRIFGKGRKNSIHETVKAEYNGNVDETIYETPAHLLKTLQLLEAVNASWFTDNHTIVEIIGNDQRRVAIVFGLHSIEEF